MLKKAYANTEDFGESSGHLRETSNKIGQYLFGFFFREEEVSFF